MPPKDEHSLLDYLIDTAKNLGELGQAVSTHEETLNEHTGVIHDHSELLAAIRVKIRLDKPRTFAEKALDLFLDKVLPGVFIAAATWLAAHLKWS